MYKVEKIPGKGEGAIATMSIKRGTIIEREKPFLALACPFTMADVLELLRKLPQDDQRRFMSLPNAHPSIPVVGIVKTNSIVTGRDCKATVFLKASKFNYSCSPNCVSWGNEAGTVGTIRAIKDILPGEELTYPYSTNDSYFSPRLVRQERISRNANFKCVCEICSLSGIALLVSEERRHELVRLEKSFGERALLNPGQALGFCRRMLTLLEEEELPMGRSTVYAYAGQVCALHGDLLRTSAFTAKYVAEIKSYQGEDGVVQGELFVKNPQMHPYANETRTWKSSRKPGPGPETPEFEEWLWERAVEMS